MQFHPTEPEGGAGAVADLSDLGLGMQKASPAEVNGVGGPGVGSDQVPYSVSWGSPCLSPGAQQGFRAGESVSVMLRLESRYLLIAGRVGLKVGQGGVRARGPFPGRAGACSGALDLLGQQGAVTCS